MSGSVAEASAERAKREVPLDDPHWKHAYELGTTHVLVQDLSAGIQTRRRETNARERAWGSAWDSIILK